MLKLDKGSISIKDWKENDRPREKLLDKGRKLLTDAELIAILIGSGNRNESAVALSTRILASVEHEIQALGKLSLNQLIGFKGIGKAKAITIMAALELGRRSEYEHNYKVTTIKSSKDIFGLLRCTLGDLEHEEFWVVYLNHAHTVLQQKQISIGGKTATLVDVRIVYRIALELGATAIVLAHNHPSGIVSPSQSDKMLTQKLKDAGHSLDINVLDHLIITEKDYFSFADTGIL